MSDDTESGVSHPLQMHGRGVFYSFSFDLGPGLDIIALADELLQKDMAAGAASPSDDDICIPTRGVVLDRESERAYHLQEFLNVMFSDNFTWRELFKHNRQLTLKTAWIHRNQLLTAVARRIAFGQSGRSTRQPTELHLPEWVVEFKRQMSEVSEGYGKMLFNDHILGTARIRLEQSLYFPGYVDTSAPYIRIEMNRAYFSDRTYVDEPIDISLMAHRSGICILTFAMPIDERFGVVEAFNYMQAGTRGFSKISISLPIAGRPDRPISLFQTDSHLWQTSHSGLDWLNAQIPSSQAPSQVFTLDSIFERYWYAILRAAGQEAPKNDNEEQNKLPGWRCHTTLFQGDPACSCNGSEAKKVHAPEFAQIMLRASINVPLEQNVQDKFLENHLIESQEELWLAAGNSIHTIWNGHRIDYIRDLRTIIAIESAILQYRQLQAVDHRTRIEKRVRDQHLFSAQDQLATSLQEYGRILLADQNGHRIVTGLAGRLQTPELYERLNNRVKLLESIVNARFTRLQSRRSLAVSIIGVAIVLALLLPRVTEFVEFAKRFSPTRSAIDAINNGLGTGNGATLATYCLMLLLAGLFFVIFPARPSFARWRGSSQSFGHSTQGALTLTSDRYDGEDEVEPPQA